MRSNGDGYCDTEADPNLQGLVIGNTQNGFTYDGSGTDNWDEQWTPDIYNIMSYSRVEAREFFSPMQVGTMYYWVLGLSGLPGIFDLHIENQFIDIYEPDNFQHPNNTIEFDETQLRGLHATRFGPKANPSFGYCDEDWVRFTVPENYSYKVNISTDPVSGAQQVDTRISLLDESGTLLISNDNKGTGEIYSEISAYELSEGDYWIQVESVGNTAGEYYLTLERCGEDCCFQELLGSATEINQTTGSFNLGVRQPGVEEFIGNSLNVHASTLFFNDSSPLGFGGSGNPIAPSHLDAKICNNAEIVIDDLGQMIVGDNASNQTADVTFSNNTKLVLEEYGIIIIQEGSQLIIEDGAELRLNGGLLRIQDGGEVIIKDGGKLIYEAGTQIELNGNDAVLALGGLTRIGDNATFTFTYQGTESGYIRLLEEGGDYERFSVGSNAQVKLKGEGQSDLIVYLEKSADFWEYQGVVPNESQPSSKFEYFRIENGKIRMEDNSRIVLLNESDLVNVRMEATDYIHKPRGIVNFTFCEIKNSSLYHVDIVAALHFMDEAPLFLTDSYFEGCQIKVTGFAMRLLNSHFYSSTVYATQSSLNNTVNTCLFEHYSQLFDDADKDLTIVKSEFYDNTHAVVKANGRVTSKCSRFERNEEAIRAEKLAEINLSTLHNGGYNYFASNTYNIYLEMAGIPLLRDGYNGMYDASQYNIYGLIDAAAPPCPDIVATNNTWTPHSGSQPGDPNFHDYNEFYIQVPNTCAVGMYFGNTVPLTKCGTHDSGGGDDHPGKSNDEPETLPLVSSPLYFDAVPFDQALYDIATQTTIADSVNGDDLLAADMYFELLRLAETDTIPSDSVAAVIDGLRWAALGNYKATMERLFFNHVLLRSNNSVSFEPVVQDYVSVLMAFTDSVKTAENYHNQFRLEWMKSALFTTLNKKTQALQIVSNVNLCNQDSLQKLMLEEQIQKLSFNMLAENQGVDMLLQDSITFVLDSSIYQLPAESFVDSSGFGSYIQSPNSVLFTYCNDAFQPKSFGLPTGGGNKTTVFPNPASTTVEVQLLNRDVDFNRVQFYLMDITGKLLFTELLKGAHTQLRLPNLPATIYLYQIKTDNGDLLDQGKLVILQ